MDKIQAAYMKDLIYDIFEELDEIKEEEKSEYNSGQSLAYATILSRIKMRIDEEAWKDFNIDFDIDGKYLQP